MTDHRSPEAAEYRKLYRTSRWTRTRKAQLSRQPLCEWCLEKGRAVAATVCDHVVPHKGDLVKFWDTGNLQSLCASCHDSDKQTFEKTGKMKRVIGLDGWPI